MPTETAQPAVAVALVAGGGGLREPSGSNRHKDSGEQTVRQGQNALALVNDRVVDEIAIQLD